MTLLTAFQVFLSRLSGQKAFVVGIQEFSHPHAEHGEQSPFVIRADLNGLPTFRQMEHRVRGEVLQAYSYQEQPIEKPGEHLHPEPAYQSTALCQALFLFQPFLPANGSESAPPWPGEMLAGCPLTLALERLEQGWQGVLTYHPDLYAASTVERWMQHWQTLLEAIVANPDQVSACLPLFTEHELASQLSAIRDNEWSSPGMSNVPEEVSWLALMYPDRVALAQREQQMSYQVLEERANQLSHVLRGCGVRPEVVVGICLPQTLDLLISQFAVLKAGGAYLVLDPDLPDEQLGERLEETGAWVILTHRQLRTRFHQSSLTVLEIDGQWPLISQASRKPLAQIIHPHQLACVVYSASAREGLSLSHAGLSSLVLMNWQFAFFEAPLQDRYTYLKCWGFDMSVWEPWTALVEGDGLLLEPHELVLPDMVSLVEARRDGVEMFILDEHLQILPGGVWGDLYIGGECLARGYLNHASLTGEHFIPHPYAQEPGERLYRTGRRARWSGDGSIAIRA
jgi:non-ribosomal peptide synthetase component F